MAPPMYPGGRCRPFAPRSRMQRNMYTRLCRALPCWHSNVLLSSPFVQPGFLGPACIPCAGQAAASRAARVGRPPLDGILVEFRAVVP